MHSVASVISQPVAIYGVVAFLAFWALLSGWSFARGTSKLAAALARATAVIQRTKDPLDFAVNYEAISMQLGSDPILGSLWREYRDTLITPGQADRPVRATSRGGAWFDFGLFRVPGIQVDLRYHAALPNLLVGAGLLFTFIGLAAALGTAGGIISAADQTGRNTALQTLLDTASFKFITSLVGLFLSIAYALFRKRRLRKVERALDGFVATLENRIPLLTPTSLQFEANEHLKRQSTQLETFSTDLAVNLASAFDKAFDDRLGQHIGPLTEAMQRLAGAQGNRNDEAMQSMTDSFLERLHGGAGDHMQGIVMSLRELGVRLEGLQTGLGDSAVRMAQSADAMATRMGEGAETALSRVTDQMGGLVETLRAMAERSQNAASEAGSQMAARIETAATGFEEAARSVASVLSGAASNFETRMGQQAEVSSARLSEQFLAMITELRGLAETSRATGTQAFAALAEQVGAAAAGFEKTATRVGESLQDAANRTGGTLERGAEDVVQRLAVAADGLGGRVSSLSAAADSIATRIAELSRSAGDAARPLVTTAEHLRSAGEAAQNAAGPLNQAANTISRSLEQIAGVAQRLTSAQAASERLIESLNTAVQRFEGVDQELARTLQGLQTGLQGFAREVATVVSQTDQNLAQAATQLGGLVNSLQASLEDFAMTTTSSTTAARTGGDSVILLTNPSR